MEGEAEPTALLIDPNHPETNEIFRYALDLLSHGFFWESHVYFEALWNAHGRQGPIADFLKALIKLGAAGVKHLIGQVQAAAAHVERALELLEAQRREGPTFLGFELAQMMTTLRTAMMQQRYEFSFQPNWA